MRAAATVISALSPSSQSIRAKIALQLGIELFAGEDVDHVDVHFLPRRYLRPW